MCYWAVCAMSRQVFLRLDQDEVKVLASVVQRVDSAINWIDLYPVESAISFQCNYTVIPLCQNSLKISFRCTSMWIYQEFETFCLTVNSQKTLPAHVTGTQYTYKKIIFHTAHLCIKIIHLIINIPIIVWGFRRRYALWRNTVIVRGIRREGMFWWCWKIT